MNARVACRLGLEVILRLAKGQPGFLRDDFDRLRSKLRVGIDAGTDRSHAKSEFLQTFGCILDTLNRKLDLPRITAKFLTQSNRRSLVQMRAADLHNLIEGFCLLFQRILETSQSGVKDFY